MADRRRQRRVAPGASASTARANSSGTSALTSAALASSATVSAEPQPEARLAARPDEPPQAGQGLTVEGGRSGGAAQGVEVAGHVPDLRR